MIISRTPYRISFFGGGTDYPDYYLTHGGHTIGTAINKYCYINVRELPPFFEYTHRFVYSKMENVKSIGEINHPAIRETMRFMNITEHISLNHDGDLPARSGMGSSSAFTCGLLNSFYALKGKIVPRMQLAKEAIHIEQKMIGENVGSQDQVLTAAGGLNSVEFLKSGEIVTTPVIMPPVRMNALQDHLLLFFTGLARTASEIAEEQIRNTEKNSDSLHEMKELTARAVDILTKYDTPLSDFGSLLNRAWNIKKKLSSRITMPKIDEVYEKGIAAGAIGGKLLGAGGGGFILFFAEPRAHENIKKTLQGFLHIPFRFDFEGSKIIVYEPNCSQERNYEI